MEAGCFAFDGEIGMEDKIKPIPASVRDLLQHRWDQGGWKAHTIFLNADDDRKQRPSNYFIQPGDKAMQNGPMFGPPFSYKDAEKLIEDGVFGSTAGVGTKNIWINEHSQHAFTDFMCEVYKAWTDYQQKLQDIVSAAYELDR